LNDLNIGSSIDDSILINNSTILHRQNNPYLIKNNKNISNLKTKKQMAELSSIFDNTDILSQYKDLNT